MDAKDICVEIENDLFFSRFLMNNIQPIVYEHQSVSEQVKVLAQGVDKLSKSLEQQVLAKHDDLLTQASHITDLETSIDSVQTHVENLLQGVDKLRDRIDAPYYALEKQAHMLERVQVTCNLLRHASKILVLYNQLCAVNNNPAKEAMILFELQELINDYDFIGIELLDDVITSVLKRTETILNNATTQLETSLQNGEKNKLLESFKVFHNLQCTGAQIRHTVENILYQLKKEIKHALNVQMVQIELKKTNSGKMVPGKANIMNSQEFKAKLWDNLENLFKNEIHNSCKKIIMLQGALDELHAIGNFRVIAKNFWDDLSLIFSTELEGSQQAINQSIEIDFPRLLKCYNELISKLKYKSFVVKRSSLVKWENAFLSKCLGKLLDPIRSMWQQNQVPTMDQIDHSVRVIAESLSISLGDKQLSLSLANSVAKGIKQMIMETEQRLSLDDDVSQIIEPPTSSQQKNAELCNILYYFSSQVKRVLINMNSILAPESVQIVQNSLKETSSLPVLQLFADSIKKSLFIILLTMKDESDLTRFDDPGSKQLTCSLYMKELQQFVSRCKDIYLSMFNEKIAVNQCCENIAKACIERFIFHVCNIRPLSNYGRAKLQADCKHLEQALAPLLMESDKREQTRQLRALHAMLDKTPQEMMLSQSAGATLPYSLVMMYSFSYATSKQLISPHVCAGWDVAHLMQWLDSHKSEKERLDFIAGALQRYQNFVRQKNITQYDIVYPMLLQMLEDGRKNLKNEM